MIDNQNKMTTYFTHGFHPYPAKFTPQIVNKFFNLYCKSGFTVLDPFCGSGTTLVEAVINKMDVVGIDLNPIAYIVSRAKSNYYTQDEINSTRKFISEIKMELCNGLFSQLEIQKKNIIVPDFSNRCHWFQENVSYELAILKQKIDEIKNENIKNLLYCAFSKIIVKVSNQDSEVRYTAKKKNHPDGTVFSLFNNTILNYLQILNSEEHAITAKADVYNGDAYEVLKCLPTNRFDFIITSPPYINTFDYYLYHKQRMYWLGFDHKPVRQKEIGNHHRIDTKEFDVAKAEYINSMAQVMDELSRVSKTNSYLIMIIGDGIIEGNIIDMSKVIEEICENCKYTVEKIENVDLSTITRSFNRKFSNAPKKEHTITLKNNKEN